MLNDSEGCCKRLRSFPHRAPKAPIIGSVRVNSLRVAFNAADGMPSRSGWQRFSARSARPSHGKVTTFMKIIGCLEKAGVGFIDDDNSGGKGGGSRTLEKVSSRGELVWKDPPAKDALANFTARDQ